MKLTIFSVFMLILTAISFFDQLGMKGKNAAESTIVSPNPSIKCLTTDTVKTDPAVEAGLCPDSNHPHMIDLGLDVKWACCNVCANSPEEYGGYYAWGETHEKNVYNFDTYKYNDSTCVKMDSNISETTYDAAHVNWGVPWRIPTLAEYKMLIKKCSYKWTSINGIKGGQFTAVNGNSIFIPAAGFRWGNEIYEKDCGGFYWLTSLDPSRKNCANCIMIVSWIAHMGSNGCGTGQPIRPVSK